MTIFPEYPRFEIATPKEGREMRRLTEDHITSIPFYFGWSLVIKIKAGYETDGATVSISHNFNTDTKTKEKIQKLIHRYFPEEEAKAVYTRLVGTPWDMPRLLAAIVHDGLYDIKWGCRFLADWVYRKILENTKYEKVKREIEYSMIRLVGWRNWNAITKEEQENARKKIEVKWVRTKDVPQKSKTFQKR